MRNPQGEWIWFELLTDDIDAAQAFYREVLGWNTMPSGMPDMDYRIFRIGDDAVGGLMQRPSDMKPGPVWLGYIGVDDVDACANAIEAAGGAVHMPPTTLPNVGRIAMLTDPQGAAFYIMRGDSDETSTAFKQCTGVDDTSAIGHTVWCELSAPDPNAAVDFYRGVLGWRQEGGIPLGELGEYRFLQAGDVSFGAVMRTGPDSGKGWLFYFQVADIDDAARKLSASGGSMLQDPTEIPGGGYSLVARDPQGAAFGLVGPRSKS